MVEQSMIALLVVVTPIIRVGNCAVSSTDLCAGFTDALNSMRQAVAKGLPGYGNVPRSQSMFALSCYYELVQAAIVNTEVCKPVNFLNGGKSMNYWAMITTRNPLTDAEIIRRAVDSWRIPVINYGLRADAVYRDKRLEAFANAVYYKSIYFGCAIKTCKATKIMPAFQAAACVFDSAPVLNRPLYTPSTAYTGCTSDQQCSNLLPGATCGTEVVPPKGLCLSNGRNFLNRGK
uniref:Venom allergen/ancylostoma secreted protein-like 13 n=1 Tax=Heligmosomoides polygyrus bakeri TaxID=375939 RepID=G4XWY1_HELBE|nr:venom allergen/ancylostoma secreted protein-like 13 [Heligmosomoides bakeri]